MSDALLVLEDGLALRGEGFGAAGTAHGELVFNTAMTGYQEVVTDPSYRGQIVTMTSCHIGVYGVNDADAESPRVQAAGLVVREASRVTSSHAAQRDLGAELAGAGCVGIAEVDTRRLTRHLRDAGAMRAAVSTAVLDADALLAAVRAAPSMTGADLALHAGTAAAYAVGDLDALRHVVVLDFGLKREQLRLLTATGCRATVLPATATADDVRALAPDGLFLSNGPGDPSALPAAVATIRALVADALPTFGICLGHQLLGLAAGAPTEKLPFGHHGANQPVREQATGAVQITSHNHGFAVRADALPADGPLGRVVATHVNLNDGVNEGLALADLPASSVQFHPEAAPGPHDARHLFARFRTWLGTP